MRKRRPSRRLADHLLWSRYLTVAHGVALVISVSIAFIAGLSSGGALNSFLVGAVVANILMLGIYLIELKYYFRIIEYAKTMNHKAKTQKQIAINSSRLASLGEMAGGIAHEINNPLGIISVTSGLLKIKLQKGTFEKEELMSHVDKIELTVMRISRIIRGMRAISRDSSEDPLELTDIKDILDDTLSACAERFKVHGVELVIDNGLKDFQINCRRVAIAQVLLNLLNNAYDAVNKLESPWIKLSVFKFESQVLFEVEDCGAGIPKKNKNRIFDPFYTTKLINKGTGLGLSISKSFIEQHGGKLYLDENSPNTKFVISLPIQETTSSINAA